MVELAIYAFVAAFIFCRLYGSLGRASGVNFVEGCPKPLDSPAEQSVRSTADVLPDVPLESVTEKGRFESVAQTIEIFRNKNKAFSLEHFMSGSAAAFEAIMDALNKENVELLTSLLHKDLCASFIAEMEHRKKRGHVHEDVIVSIKSHKIYDVDIVNDTASITLRLVTEQINVIRNSDNEIVSGSVSEINVVEDYWTFEKCITSPDMKWYLSSTKL